MAETVNIGGLLARFGDQNRRDRADQLGELVQPHPCSPTKL
jgi:hypothetical protein